MKCKINLCFFLKIYVFSLWLLSFNRKQCKVMHLDYNNNPLNHYFLDGVLLEEVKAKNDLAPLVSENLGLDICIRSCIKDANRCIGWINRNQKDSVTFL